MEKILVWNCGNDLPNAEKEVERLKRLSNDQYKVYELPQLTWKTLGGYAAAVKPAIFHFIGHGDRQGNLTVHGSSFGLPAKSVIKKVRVASPGLKGVYLSACFSAADGPELLEDLPPAGGWVVGTGLAVDDDQAEEFAEMFYQHLVTDALSPKLAYDLAHSHITTNWGGPDDVAQAAWFNVSQMPPVDKMVRNIETAVRGVLGRPAFRFPMSDEGSIKELEAALNDVSHALGTGEVLSRTSGNPIQPASFPAVWLHAPEVEKFVTTAMRKIALVRRLLSVIAAGALDDRPVIGGHFRFDATASKSEWMNRMNEVDLARNEVLKAANKLFEHGEAPPLAMIDRSYTKRQIDAARSSVGIS